MNDPNAQLTQQAHMGAQGVGNAALGGVYRGQTEAEISIGGSEQQRTGWQDPIGANAEAEHQALLTSPVSQDPTKAVEQMAQAAPPEIPGWRE